VATIFPYSAAVQTVGCTNRHNHFYGTVVLTVVLHLVNNFTQNIKCPESLRVSHTERKIGRGCKRKGRRGKCLELKGVKLWETGENCNEQQHDLNCSPDIWVIRTRRLRRNIHLQFGSKTEGNISFWRRRHRWECTRSGSDTQWLEPKVDVDGKIKELFINA